MVLELELIQKSFTKYSRIFLTEYSKFIKKLLLLLFFYLFSYAVGVVAEELHLVVFLNVSYLSGALIWFMAFSSVIIFYFESEKRKLDTAFVAVTLVIIYFFTVIITFSLISSYIQHSSHDIYTKSDMAMFLAFFLLIILIIFHFVSKRKLNLSKYSGANVDEVKNPVKNVDPIQNHS